jgi:heptosyltransferase III
MGRILIIRGGAIGDFILTLPALNLVREAFPDAHIEIIGYRHIVALAEGRYYADAARSIEYGPLAGFFARRGSLDDELCEYFSGFQQVISFLFDPDGIFETNLRRSDVRNFLSAYVKVDDSSHAARQLARPLEALALFLENPAANFFPSEEDRAFATDFLHGEPEPPIAIHPGSGSPRKNWPLARWRELIFRLPGRILLAGGEADHATLDMLIAEFPSRVLPARDLPLPRLAAILAVCRSYIGHDSGISHLAAAAGTPSTLLFGPTDPDVWAPHNPNVKVIRAPEGDLERLSVDGVQAALNQ